MWSLSGTAGQRDLLNVASSAGGIFNTTPQMEKLFRSKRLHLHSYSAASQYHVETLEANKSTPS
jgi:hypothetical protein